MHRAFERAALAAVIVLVSGAASAGVIYVDADAMGAGNGSSWTNAATDLALALANVGPGDELWIAEGTYTPPAIDQPFDVPRGVALYGGFDGTETARDQRDPETHVTRLSGDLNGDDGADPVSRAENAYTVVLLDSPNAGNRLDGLTISGGEGVGPFVETFGGGVDVLGGTLVIDTCRFEGNQAENDGGAIWIDGADSVTVRSSVFESNRAGVDSTAAFGGAIETDGNELRLESCAFIANEAAGNATGAGGAVSVAGGALVAEGCVFTDNRVTSNSSVFGGAVRIRDAARSTLADCEFTGNRVETSNANFGGAVHVSESPVDFVRCAFEDNATSLDATASLGGAVSMASGELVQAEVTLVGCRIVGNRAETGGAIASTSIHPGVLRIAGSVISGNEAFSLVAIRHIGEATIVNSTVAGNGLLIPGSSAAAVSVVDGPLSLANSVLWANGDDADQLSEILVSEPATIANSCIEGWDGSLGGAGNFSADPLFRDPNGDDGTLGTADDDYTLLRYSPCIDSGSNAAIPADRLDADSDGDTAERLPIDIDGNPRRVDDIDVDDTGSGDAPIVDIGAIEFQRRSCPADLDQNGILDLSDINAFVVGFPAQDPSTDLNGDGVWDLSDINRFVTVFTGGCP